MRNKFIILFLSSTMFFAIIGSVYKTPAIEVVSRENLYLNEDWSYSLDNSEFIRVDLPHTSKLEPLIVNDQWQGKMTYKKNLVLDRYDQGKTFLHFEGVMHTAVISVNQVKVKEHCGGYLPFAVDISSFLKEGANEITVEVDNRDNPNVPPGKPLGGLDFNYYGGIYRDVWLIRKNKVYITDPFVEESSQGGVLVHFDEVSKNKAKGQVRLHVRNDSQSKSDIRIEGTLKNDEVAQQIESRFYLKPLSDSLLLFNVEVDNPKLWSILTPDLYDLNMKLYSGQSLLDELNERVGIRKIELTDDGFYLNDKEIYIRGTNRHQEYPYVGYAISNNANYRDALKIKNAGFDFVRLSHYPQDESFLDACDELGIMVMNAIPGWQYFEDGEFTKNSLNDIREMVRRDRNHPSVVFWEVSLNESEMSEEYILEANRILKEELPFSDTYSAGWIDHPSYDLFIPARQHAKPPNYWNLYKKGKRKVFIAEYGDWEYYAHNAGFNQTAFADLTDAERNSRQLREAGEARLLQQALNFQEAANSNRHGVGTIGHANWLMFDYNRGYANDLEASGISDIFRIPKFAYYFYRSQRSAEELVKHPLVDQGPIAKIASYWTEDSPLSVKVFSNCQEVALHLNGKLISRNRPEADQFSNQLLHPPFEFDIDNFEPGELKAVGFIDGAPVAEDMVLTPGQPAALKLKIDSVGGFGPEAGDIYMLHAQIVDGSGSTISNAGSHVRFDIEGTGEIIGENPIPAKAGIASILLKTHGSKGSVNIRAQSQPLAAAEFLFSY